MGGVPTPAGSVEDGVPPKPAHGKSKTNPVGCEVVQCRNRGSLTLSDWIDWTVVRNAEIAEFLAAEEVRWIAEYAREQEKADETAGHSQGGTLPEPSGAGGSGLG